MWKCTHPDFFIHADVCGFVRVDFQQIFLPELYLYMNELFYMVFIFLHRHQWLGTNMVFWGGARPEVSFYALVYISLASLLKENLLECLISHLLCSFISIEKTIEGTVAGITSVLAACSFLLPLLASTGYIQVHIAHLPRTYSLRPF